MSSKFEIYRTCKDIKREKPNIIIDKELADKIGENYRTLPIFQQGLYENTLKQHYSLQTNELLKCRWRQYKKHIDERIFAPFQFLDIRFVHGYGSDTATYTLYTRSLDYHFYNQRNQLLPSQSVHTKTNHRKNLKPGPSVDDIGSRPIPQELLMKRSGSEGKPRSSKRGQGKKQDKK